MGWLEDDVVIVTGAGSGLGRALVDRFVAEGARVVAFERDARTGGPDREPTTGTPPSAWSATSPSAADNARAVDVALTRFGRLDSFVANAGMFDYGAGLMDTPVEALERAFDELFAST